MRLPKRWIWPLRLYKLRRKEPTSIYRTRTKNRLRRWVPAGMLVKNSGMPRRGLTSRRCGSTCPLLKTSQAWSLPPKQAKRRHIFTSPTRIKTWPRRWVPAGMPAKSSGMPRRGLILSRYSGSCRILKDAGTWIPSRRKRSLHGSWLTLALI